MTDFIGVIKGRRSIRKYEEKDVPEELLNQVFEAVRWSPSWRNTQVWEIIVIKDPAIKDKLSQTLAPKNPSTKAIANAPVVLAVCGKLKTSGFFEGHARTKLGDMYMYDLGLATQNLCLAAHYLGLGSVVVGSFDIDKAEEILGVPEGYGVVVLIPLGYPAKGAPAPKRREIAEFIHADRFGQRKR